MKISFYILFLARASQRKLLKNDVIPTIFTHNSNKQPQKRKLSVLREEARVKRQLCEEAVIHQEQVDIFEFECNTKGTQTEMTLEDLYFQSKAFKKVDFGVQCFIEDSDEQQHATLNDIETESENCDESDESEKSFDESDISITEGHPINTIKPPKAAFIVYWTSLKEKMFTFNLLVTCYHIRYSYERFADDCENEI